MKRFGVQLAAGGLVILLGALGVAQAQRDTQKEEPDEWETQTPAATSAPVPIAAAEDQPFPDFQGADSSEAPPAFAQPDFQNAAFLPAPQADDADPSDAAPQAVRQVAHEDAFAPPPLLNDEASVPPSDGASVPPSEEAAAGPSGFGLPAGGFSGATTDPPHAQHSPQSPAASAYDFGDEAAGPTAPQYHDSAQTLPEFTTTASSADQADEQGLVDEQPLTQPESADLPVLQFAAGPVNELRNPSPAAAETTANEVETAAPEVTSPDLATPDMGGFETAMAASDVAASEGPAPYGAPASEPTEPVRSDYDQPQYGAVPYQAAPLATAAELPAAPESPPQQATPLQAAQPLREAEPAQQTQPPQQGEAFVGVDRREASEQAAQSAPAVTPAARIASATSATPVPLGELDADVMEIMLNEPGDRRLEGMQSPSIIIQKRAPEEVKVGKPAAFVIQVENVGGAEALDVQVHDRIPSGMRLVDASPQPQQHGDVLVWKLGALEPGGERTVSMQLVPEQEGELGSVARVTFEAAASVRTISTRPALKITQQAPEQVLIGQQLEIELEVSNPGTGAATGVVMQEDVPDGLEHPKGRQLDNLIGTLKPGEVRRQVLRLRAVAPGVIENHIRLIGDDDLTADNSVRIEVIAPELAIELEGPTRRFLERQATYQINLANIGSAEATNVEIVAYLDRGFSFVGTEYQGQYDSSRHAVYWSLAELPPEGRGSVPLTLLPIEQGERAIRLEARGDLNLIARNEKKVNVDALAELSFSITDDADPIEVDSTVTYEVRITNRGSGEDADVSLKLQLPPGLELVSSDNDASTDGNGLVVFAPQSVMAARSESVHRVRVRGTAPGTHLVKAVVSSRESPVKVTKEESTTVYADQ